MTLKCLTKCKHKLALETLKSFNSTLEIKEKEPKIDIGWHCKNPHTCLAFDYCWKEQRNIPEYSVFNIFPLSKK